MVITKREVREQSFEPNYSVEWYYVTPQGGVICRCMETKDIELFLVFNAQGRLFKTE